MRDYICWLLIIQISKSKDFYILISDQQFAAKFYSIDHLIMDAIDQLIFNGGGYVAASTKFLNLEQIYVSY